MRRLQVPLLRAVDPRAPRRRRAPEWQTTWDCRAAVGESPTRFDPDAGSFPNDLRALDERVVEQLPTGPCAAILLSLMDAAERNPDLAALLAAAQTKLVESVRTILARA